MKDLLLKSFNSIDKITFYRLVDKINLNKKKTMENGTEQTQSKASDDKYLNEIILKNFR